MRFQVDGVKLDADGVSVAVTAASTLRSMRLTRSNSFVKRTPQRLRVCGLGRSLQHLSKNVWGSLALPASLILS